MLDEDELETKPKLLVTDTTNTSSGGVKEPRSIFSSLLSNDSGFKSEHQTASSSSSSSSNSSVNNEPPPPPPPSTAQSDLLKPQLSRSSEESVPPIMVDCHSAAAATVANAVTALVTSVVNENNKEDIREIKPIPIKKTTLPEFADEEMNLAESTFRFKPTGAVFKSISHSRTSLNSTGNIYNKQ